MNKSDIRFFDLFSQQTLVISSSRPTRCFFCSSIHSRNVFPDSKKGIPKLFNMIHSELDIDETILDTLKTIKSTGAKCRLWTPLLYSSDIINSFFDYVDEWVIYLPVANQAFYRKLTGFDAYERVLKSLNFLGDHQQAFSLYMPIKSETVSYVPDVHDLAFHFSVPLYLYFSSQAFRQRDTVKFILRYRSIKDVYVFKMAQSVFFPCSVKRGTLLVPPWQWGMNRLRYTLFGFKK
ncbi:MAG: hypothetical protein VW378_00440 [bacterium]